MNDAQKTKQQLIEELALLRRRVAAFEANPTGDVPASTDVTEAEQDRDRLQAILTAAIECLPFEFFALGTDGRYLCINAASRDRFGNGVGKRPDEYAPDPATLQLWQENNRRALAGEKVQGEFQRQIGDQTRYFLNVISPIRQAEKLYGILGINIDITDRKLAEQALERARDELEQRVEERTAELTAANEKLQREVEDRRRADEALRQIEERQRSLLEACPDAVLLCNQDGRILFASRQTWKLLRIPDEEDLVGRSVLDFVVESDRSRLTANITNVLAGNLRRGTEYTFLRRDGSTVSTEASSAPIFDAAGKPEGAMSVIRDITSRKRVETALRASEERFRIAFEEAPVGMVMVVQGATITRVNRAFCRMSGYTQDELIGKTMRDITYAEDYDRFDELWGKLVSREISSYHLEKRYVGKSRPFFWTYVTTVAIVAPDAGVDFMLAIIEDITDRKQAETAFQQEHRMLEYMLHASDHERQLIAYDIHDGLAQQLAGAIMQFQVYDSLKTINPSDSQKAYFGGVTLLRQAHLEARRLISGVRPPALDESGVVAAIVHLIDDHRATSRTKIEFQSKVGFHRLVAVLENVIYRIVQEGLTNALMHSKSEQVRVSLLEHDAYVRIKIQDWGIGFDLDTVRKDRFGLAGIRERARLLGGRCRIDSNPGQGTTVLVDLPLVERGESQA
ncbi:MAG: PAS domain S-box protein [Thermoguttaceae bacterium]